MPALAPVAAGAARAPADAGSDVYLQIRTKRGGPIKGEALTKDFEDSIIVRSWNFGVAASSAIGSTQATARRSYKGLTIVKYIDTATTPLMAALATNDEVKEAKLTMCKTGQGHVPYMFLTLNNARIVAIDHGTDQAGNTTEVVTILFTKLKMEYQPQKDTGGRGASFVFEDEVLPAA